MYSSLSAGMSKLVRSHSSFLGSGSSFSLCSSSIISANNNQGKTNINNNVVLGVFLKLFLRKIKLLVHPH